jgi:hypothetical protein
VSGFSDQATLWCKGDADLYHVALENTSAPLVVKTLKDSLALAKMFKVSPDNAVRMDLVSETVNSQCNIEF